MNLAEALLFLTEQIKSNKTHKDYQRVVDLAKEYHAHISGYKIEDYLRKFVPRESDEMFEQRKALTNSISPAVCSSLMKPFYKVSRNDKIKTEINLQNPDKETIIKKMMKTFYGSEIMEEMGLDYWLKVRFPELSFIDPNAFVVIEWEAKPENEIATPRPLEISSEQAINYSVNNEEIEWLVAKFGIIYKALEKDAEVSKTGFKFNLYEKDITLVAEQVDEHWWKKNGKLLPNQTLVEINKNFYVFSVSYPKTGFIPAFRIGYKRDIVTDSRTYVNPFESAMPYLRKGLKTVSELDLTMTLHVFPQKWQYVQKCEGESKAKRCSGGKVPTTGEECSVCKGSGVKVVTSAQEVMLLPLPDTKDDLFPLDQLSAYKSPPIDLVKFQDEYVRQTKIESHYAVFNSNMFLSYEPQFAKTATEVDTNNESIYDTIEPYTEKYSSIWKTVVKTMVSISAFKGEAKLMHIFPADLKLKTTAVVLQELKSATESGAPSFMRDAITYELAGLVFAGDDVGKLKYYTRHRFFPFNGKTPTEIEFLMASPYVSEQTKVLYANFEAIFTDIEKEMPEFYQKNYPDQWEILLKAIEPYQKEVSSSNAVTINLTTDGQPQT